MSHDLVIRGGSVVDGTGAAARTADIAVDGGLITAVGKVEAKGRREIDADGLLVTPGFVDLHTHLDAQIGWDPDLTPVSWHGVTTALLGNCGLTFAPCKPADRPLLAAMMETVEDIPREAILSGLPWSWEDYGGYLDALDGIRPGINVAGLVGHCAVRYAVMGDRSFSDQATPDELAQICAIVGEAMDRGALGFSTNRYEPHKAPDGRSIPGTFADVCELEAIARTVGARGGLMQAVGASPEVLQAMADAGARVLFSWGVGAQKGAGRGGAEYLDRMIGERDMTAIIQVRGTGFMFGLQSHLPFRGETWDRIRKLDLAGRLAAIRDAATREALIAEGRRTDGWKELATIYDLGSGDSPDHGQDVDRNMRQVMEATGKSFVEIFLEQALATEGRGLFNLRLFCQNLDELGDLFASRNILPSLGDAGAHVSQIMDADWSTFVLSYWVRDRGVYSLEEGVRRITSAPARVLGLTDRGVLAPGQRADINVIDLAELRSLQPQIVNDFPGGAPRYVQRARGYRATIVNGGVNIEDDRHTGERAGQVLRRVH
ncbi:amidohydrolase family protein [Phenylobacterium sp.]|uniref:N-acyl-D-amino-acid deacylase family protein n=1 Tax=Phenylobacterium sp. TaxID=1871053 RepID=UPI0025EBE0D3|nr:amidohydrolase family protein [Phenylobacterium sp.]MCA3715019.1 amidohydrolase family protein [Phenylobacterium sp.]